MPRQVSHSRHATRLVMMVAVDALPVSQVSWIINFVMFAGMKKWWKASRCAVNLEAMTGFCPLFKEYQ